MKKESFAQFFQIEIRSTLSKSQWRTSFILSFFIVLLYSLFLQLAPIDIGRRGGDHQEYLAAIELGYGENSPADRVITTLTPYFTFGPLFNAVPTFALCIALSMTFAGITGRSIIISLFLLFNIIFQLKYISKESIVILLFLSSFLIYRTGLQGRLFFLVICSLLIGLAITFRHYYAISVAFAATIYFAKRPMPIMLLCLAGLVAASLIPEVRDTLLDARYQVYGDGASLYTVASRIPMLMHGYSPVDFIVNYFTSLFFIIFPIAVGQRSQELYAQLFMVIVVLNIVKGIRSGERATLSIFLGCALTVPVFVPDLGTATRHISGLVPFLIFSVGHSYIFAAGSHKHKHKHKQKRSGGLQRVGHPSIDHIPRWRDVHAKQ
jgi:hypothetical protein